jgi:hypothetical protein
MIPIEVIFNPNWWNQNYGICFDEFFYLDLEKRIENHFVMKNKLYERFGIGEKTTKREPIIGSMMVAGGFVLPALFGVHIEFSDNEAPWPIEQSLTDEEIFKLVPPDVKEIWPMKSLLNDASELIDKFGYVVGDFDLDGFFNTALHIRGHQLFFDLVDKPDLVNHLFHVLVETYISLVKLMRSITKTCSISTNRSIVNVNPSIFLHSNCSVSMISPKLYEMMVFPHELRLAKNTQPFGIHHCGNNMHKFSKAYLQIPSNFFDVGWGSDINKSSETFSDTFINLRLNPVRLLQYNKNEIYQDTVSLLKSSKRIENVGVCCINMDADTPDENVRSIFQAVNDYEDQFRRGLIQ